MSGIRSSTRQPDSNRLAINLTDILPELGDIIATTEWEISEVECIGKDADRLHKIPATKAILNVKNCDR